MEKPTNDLMPFEEHLNIEYGVPGTESRVKYEEEFETFKQGSIIEEMRVNTSTQQPILKLNL